jgi:hypothetical protein
MEYGEALAKMLKAQMGIKDSSIEPATPEELRIISSAFDILIFCCKTKTDFPCADGKGIQEYTEMRDSLRALADKLEKEEKS